jgi:glycosyltransferase involved in cell wall biosynthesis
MDVDSVRSSLGIPEEHRMVLALGRHEKQKGYPDLLAAFGLLDRSDTHLVIAGREGSATPDVRRALDDLGDHADRVHVIGHRSDVGSLLAAADALTVSSLFEGAAGVVIEAMAARVPIVSTQLAGLEGVLIDEVNAVTVPGHRPDLLAAALERVLSDPVLRSRLVDAAFADFHERFTLDMSAGRMVDLYRSVVATSVVREGTPT